MLRDLVEIGLSYGQYLFLLVAIAPELFPSYYNWPADALRYLNLDMQQLLSEDNRSENFLSLSIPEQLPLDIRLQFVIVSVIVPLLLAVISLFSLSSKIFFFWFLFFLSGVMFLVVALLAFVIDDPLLSTQFSSDDRAFTLYIGIAIFIFAVAVALTYRSVMHSREHAAKERARKARRRRRARLRSQGVEVSSSSSSGGEGDDEEMVSHDDTEENAVFTLGSSSSASSTPKTKTRKKQRKQRTEGSPGAGDGRRAGAVMAAVADAANVDAGGGSDGDGDDASDAGGEAGKSLQEIMEREAARLSVLRSAERFLYAAVCLFFGLLLIRAFKIPAIYNPQSRDSVIIGLGATLFSLGAILFVWFCLGLTHRGRIWMFKISMFARDNFVSVLLLLVTVLYVPAVSNIVAIVNCQEFTCGPGSRPFDPFSVVRAPVNGMDTDRCEVCDFSMFAQSCPLDLQLALCNVSSTAERLVENPTVDCAPLRKYYWPASGIMLVSFVISMPLLNFLLTKKSTVTLEGDFPLDARQIEGYTEEELYEEKMHLSDNVAKFIYDPFQRRYKHWRTLFLFQKLCVVLSAVYAFPAFLLSPEAISILLNLVVHTICVVYVLVTSPFNRKVENLFTIFTQVVLVMTASCVMASTQGTPPPPTVFIVVAVFTFLMPAGALAVGAVLTFRDNMRKSRDREERVTRAQRAAAEGDGQLTIDQQFSGHNREEEMGSFLPGQEMISPGMKSGGSGPETSNTALSSRLPLMPLNLVHPNAKWAAHVPHDDPSGEPLPNVPTICGVVITQGPTMAPLWFNPSKLNLESPMHRYAHAALLRRRRGIRTAVGQQATTTAAMLRSPAAGRIADQQVGRGGAAGDSPANGSRSISPMTAQRQFNFLAAVPDKHRTTPGSLSPGAPSSVSSPRVSSFVARIGSERWARIRQALLDKVRSDRAKAEAEHAAQQHAAGPGSVVQEFFSDNGNVVKPKPKGQKAMKRWDVLLQELLKKGREEKEKREAAGSATTAAAKNPARSPAGSPGGDKGPTSKRQQLALRAELKRLYEQHLEKLRSQQQAVDFKINKLTIEVMQMFYVCVGVMAFVAVGFCVLGVLSNTPPPSFIRSSVSAAVRSDEMSFVDQLASYTSWIDFTTNCCCMGFTNTTGSAPLYPHFALTTEKWLCRNGVVKERIREYRIRAEAGGSGTDVRSGLALRPLCGMVFLPPGCNVLEDIASGRAVLTAGCNVTSIGAAELTLW